MSYQIGKRYRVCDQAHSFDGRIGTLEVIDGPIGFLLRNGEVKKVALSCLSDRGVLQSVPEQLPQPDHFVRIFEVLETQAV